MVDEECKNIIIVLLNKTTAENPDESMFRPISLLSLISMKAIEKLILKRMNLNTNKFQFGFKKYNSCDSMFFMLKAVLDHCKNLSNGNIGMFTMSM